MTWAQVARATTWLFVPGSRPDRFAKALGTGADMVILDLEDAVAPAEKDAARRAVSAAVGSDARYAIRINALGSRWYEEDRDMVLGHRRPVVVPKAEDAAALDELSDCTDGGVIALIETAAGVLKAPSIARAEGVTRLALGNVDLAAQIGADPADHEALAWARSSLVLASAAADIAAPLDGVTMAVADAARVAADAEHGRRLGFGGKLCIHPAQVSVVRSAYRPTPEQVAWARRVISESGGAVSQVDGEMVDRPVVLRAQGVLAAAGLGKDLKGKDRR